MIGALKLAGVVLGKLSSVLKLLKLLPVPISLLVGIILGSS
jgi:hypothetical protein